MCQAHSRYVTLPDSCRNLLWPHGSGASEALPVASMCHMPTYFLPQEPSPAGPLPRVLMKQKSKCPRHFLGSFLMDLFSSLLRCGTQDRTTLPAGGSFTPCRPQNWCLLSPMVPLLYWVFTMWQAGWWFWCYGYMKSLTLCRDGKVKLREVVLDAWGYTAR